jgi:hypothetical protein
MTGKSSKVVASGKAADAHANRLLGLLSAGDYKRLRPHLHRIPLEYRQSLYGANKPIGFIYFIETGVGSLVNTMTNGQAAEVGTSLVALQKATNQAADLLKASCLTDDPLTPPARLAAVGKRLDTMLQAVKMVSSALNDFYGTLSDEQKARFEAIGPQQTSRLESLEVAPTNVRRRGPPSAEQIIRRLMSPFF